MVHIFFKDGVHNSRETLLIFEPDIVRGDKSLTGKSMGDIGGNP